MTMTTKPEFIDREIVPTLGEFADDFDLEAIADEVSRYDERRGYVWRDEYDRDEDPYGAETAYAAVTLRHVLQAQ